MNLPGLVRLASDYTAPVKTGPGRDNAQGVTHNESHKPFFACAFMELNKAPNRD